MKKVILTLSLAAASSLMAANIDLYGVAHMSADSVNNGTTRTSILASNASRLGVKGSTEIKNGLTVLGQFEMGIDLTGSGKDDGNGGDFDSNAGIMTSARDSFVGVEGGFGKIIAGNLPGVNQWMYDYNLFADQIGDLGNIWGGASSGPDRASNSVAYFIPTVVEGLSGDIAYISDSNENNGTKSTGMLVKANYETNGLKVGLGYLKLNNDANPQDEKNIVVTGSYSKDNFSIGGGYLKVSNAGGGTTDRSSYNIGGSFSMSDITLKAQYTTLDDDVANNDSDMIAIGVDYALSSDATLYIAYAATDNDSGATYKANNWGHGKSAYGAPAVGQDPSAVSLGLVYKFGGNIYTK